jgi:ribosomal protein S18 acetylase RimI-like enzyme
MSVLNLPRSETGGDAEYRSPLRPPRRGAFSVPAQQHGEGGHKFETRDGVEVRLRPIHPSDFDALKRAFSRMTPEQIRLRVFHAMTELADPIARHLCRDDIERVAAYVVTDADGSEIRGEARVDLDPVAESAEFAIAIDPAFVGRGVGYALMSRLIETSRERGMREIWGDVLVENAAMLDLGERLGFTRKRILGDPGLVRLSRDLIESA